MKIKITISTRPLQRSLLDTYRYFTKVALIGEKHLSFYD